jgi:hypothetical protein
MLFAMSVFSFWSFSPKGHSLPGQFRYRLIQLVERWAKVVLRGVASLLWMITAGQMVVFYAPNSREATWRVQWKDEDYLCNLSGPCDSWLKALLRLS